MKFCRSTTAVVPVVITFVATLLVVVGVVDAFALARVASESPLQVNTCYSTQTNSLQQWGPIIPERQSHVAIRRQRRSVASVQTQGLFGLGAPEIVVILVAVAFVLGPQKLAEIGKEAGKTAGEYGKELKNVPEEFKKGYDETQTDIRAKKAKPMDPLPKEVKGSDE